MNRRLCELSSTRWTRGSARREGFLQSRSLVLVNQLGVEAIARHRFISFLGSVLLIASVIVAIGVVFYVLRSH